MYLPSGLHSHVVEFGAWNSDTFFLDFRSQTSIVPVKFPNPALRLVGDKVSRFGFERVDWVGLEIKEDRSCGHVCGFDGQIGVSHAEYDDLAVDLGYSHP
jgi:hypothetical protein